MTALRRRTIATLIALAPFLSGCNGKADIEKRLADLRSERRSLFLQFFAVQNSIRQVQALALKEPGVAAQQDSFEVALKQHVQGTDPEGAALLARAAAVGEDLHLLSGPVILAPGDEDPRLSDEERRQVAAELTEVERALRPVIDRAMADSVVSARFGVLRDSLVATMVRLEPAARATIDLMTGIEGKIAAIDAEMRALTD